MDGEKTTTCSVPGGQAYGRSASEVTYLSCLMEVNRTGQGDHQTRLLFKSRDVSLSLLYKKEFESEFIINFLLFSHHLTSSEFTTTTLQLKVS